MYWKQKEFIKVLSIIWSAADPFKSNDFTSDPFGGDPFKSNDPFASDPVSTSSDPFQGDDPFSSGLTNGQTEGELTFFFFFISSVH